MREEDKICALCKHQKLIKTMTFCGHPKQTVRKLKEVTHYNDFCPLYELRDESFYEDQPRKNHEDEK